MNQAKRQNFSRIVCSEPSVREAFRPQSLARFWWRLILLLHGKPVQASLPLDTRIQRVAEGFAFYAGLYRLLAGMFFLLATSFLALAMASIQIASLYWTIAIFAASVYLWCASCLGYSGARAYSDRDQPNANTALITFLIMIIAFLSLFVAVVSAVAHYSAWLPDIPNVAVTGSVFLFGIGSYMIEVIYLTTENFHRQCALPPAAAPQS